MALNIYSETSIGVYLEHSVNGEMSSPISSVHHGRNGDTYEFELFVRADNSNDYTLVQVTPISSGDDIGSGSNPGTTGWGVKLLVGASEPTETQWAQVDYGETIDLADISGDTNIYLPFWYRIESPRGESVQNKISIQLELTYTET